MKANYHTHTWRCGHALGTEREYVERAIENGWEILGFSDHTPYPYPEDYVSGMRMRMGQLEDYVDTVLALKREYREDIEICLGLEVEYYLPYFYKLQEFVSGYPIEYFLLAQHCVGCEIGGTWCGSEISDPGMLKGYCAQTGEAMETGYFTYFAHPDLINYTGSGEAYEEEIRKLCRRAKNCGMPLEINCLGIYENRNYPNESFWEIAGQEECEAVLGLDAHNPEAFARPQVERRGREMAEKYGLTLKDTVEFRRPW